MADILDSIAHDPPPIPLPPEPEPTLPNSNIKKSKKRMSPLIVTGLVIMLLFLPVMMYYGINYYNDTRSEAAGKKLSQKEQQDKAKKEQQEAKDARTESQKKADQKKKDEENKKNKGGFDSEADCLAAGKGKNVCSGYFAPQTAPAVTIPSNGKEDCEKPATGGGKGGVWCGGCGGFCSNGAKACNSAMTDVCGEIPTYGANYIKGNCTSQYNISCTCGSTSVCFDRGQQSQCNTGDGLCAVFTNSENSLYKDANGVPYAVQPKSMYICKNKFTASSTQQSCVDQAIKTVPKCFCGTVQIDIPGSGYKSYEMKCGCDGKENDNNEITEVINTPTTTPTPTLTGTSTPTPTTSTNTSTPTPTTSTNTSTPTPTTIPLVGCNSACTVNTDCSSSLVCIEGNCRSATCPEKTTCSCDVAARPTPKTPVSGTGPSVLGITTIVGGFLLVLLGLAL